MVQMKWRLLRSWYAHRIAQPIPNAIKSDKRNLHQQCSRGGNPIDVVCLSLYAFSANPKNLSTSLAVDAMPNDTRMAPPDGSPSTLMYRSIITLSSLCRD